MVKDTPEAAKQRKRREKVRLAKLGLKRSNGIVVPIDREAELKAIAARMTNEHLQAHQVSGDGSIEAPAVETQL